MPAATSPLTKPAAPAKTCTGITKLTNCRLLLGSSLVPSDLWISAETGKILPSQSTFYASHLLPDRTIDLSGRIVSPGFIDVQLNGAFGFNFSTLPKDVSQYPKQLAALNKQLVTTGVTSYVPTITSQTSDLYKKVLPFLAPSSMRSPDAGATSLGAHVEGPFLSPTKNGIHNSTVLRTATSFSDLEDMYGKDNLSSLTSPDTAPSPPAIKMITAAPEQGAFTSLIPGLTRRGIVVSIGHSEATYSQARKAVAAGAGMVTHLFNAMAMHHRDPGIFGVLAAHSGTDSDREDDNEEVPRPWYGVIADGIHLHPSMVRIAFGVHPDGLILVTDAMHLLGMQDGRYVWTNGGESSWIVKRGDTLRLEETGGIAGSCVTLLDCINNFLSWTGAGIPCALRAVTMAPATMLGIQGVRGTLEAGADADLVVLSEEPVSGGRTKLVVDEVWKFGVRVC